MAHADAELQERVERLERDLDQLRGDVGDLMALMGCVPSRRSETESVAPLDSQAEQGACVEAASEATEPVVCESQDSGQDSEQEAEPGPPLPTAETLTPLTDQPPESAPVPASSRVSNWIRQVEGTTPVTVPVPAGPLAPPAPSLERRIGGQVFAVAGALIVIIGLGFAVKVAVDYGWFRVIPPSVRCAGIAVFGAAFLGVGELLRKRVWPIATAGCNAVGVAGLYIGAYAAFGVFGLIPAPVAFPLMALAAGVGLVVAVRHGFLSTGLLSLIGAYLVPILLARSDADPRVLPLYLLLLSSVSLTLAAARARPFSPMRDAAWVGTALLGLMWTASTASAHPWLVLVFWACVWVLHQAELLVTASRGRLRPAADRSPQAGEGRASAMPGRRVEPVLLAVATTAGVVVIAALTLEHRLDLEPWLATAAAFLATGVMATVFGGHLRVLRDTPRTDLETLAVAHAAQAGGLLIASVALAFTGWVEATAWLAMGVAAVLAGRWIIARSLEAYGLVLLTIATVRVCTFDLLIGSAGTPWTTDAPLAIAPWTVLIIAAGAAWLLVARLMLYQGRDEDGAIVQGARAKLAPACAAIGIAAWAFAPAHPESSAIAVCIAWLFLSLMVRVASRFERRLCLAELSLVLGVGLLLPWLAGADIEGWLDSAAPLGTHPGAWLGVVCAAALLGHAWCARRWDASASYGRVWPVLPMLAGGVLFVASSFEVARGAAMVADDMTARRAAVSIWWGLWGVSLVVVGLWRRFSPARYVGLAVMSIAACKAVLLDLAGVPPLWRVASFVGLGVLMLGVAVLYGRVSASLQASERAGEHEDAV